MDNKIKPCATSNVVSVEPSTISVRGLDPSLLAGLRRRPVSNDRPVSSPSSASLFTLYHARTFVSRTNTYTLSRRGVFASPEPATVNRAKPGSTSLEGTRSRLDLADQPGTSPRTPDPTLYSELCIRGKPTVESRSGLAHTHHTKHTGERVGGLIPCTLFAHITHACSNAHMHTRQIPRISGSANNE